jgi:hypothetical protein
MATTIQVAEATLGALRELKEQLRAQSYDEVLQALLITHRKRTMPLRGLTPGIGPFVRDHNDRD